MKKGIVLLLCFLLSGMGLFANGASETKSSDQKKPVEISITYATGDVTTKQAVHDIIQNFNESQNVYRLQENLSISTGAYLDSLKTLQASGQMPDIFECRDVPVFVRAEMLEPLPQDLQTLFETTIPIYGTVYTAPISAQPPHFILYNKALFTQWDIDTNPKTYGEFLQICEELKAHGIAPMAAGVADIWHIGFLFNYFTTQYASHGDPEWIAKIYRQETRFNTPGMIEAMTKLSDLFRNGNMEKGFMSTKESQLVSLLVGEKAAMIFTGPWTITQIMEADPNFQLGFFPIPDEEGNLILQGGPSSQGWALTKVAAEDPTKKAGFEAFLKYFFNKEQYTYFLQTTNSFPTTKETMSYKTSPIMEGILSMNNAYPKVPFWNAGVGENELPPSFRNWTYKKVQQMLMGQLSPEQLVKDMDAQWIIDTRDFNPTELVKSTL